MSLHPAGNEGDLGTPPLPQEMGEEVPQPPVAPEEASQKKEAVVDEARKAESILDKETARRQEIRGNLPQILLGTDGKFAFPGQENVVTKIVGDIEDELQKDFGPDFDILNKEMFPPEDLITMIQDSLPNQEKTTQKTVGESEETEAEQSSSTYQSYYQYLQQRLEGDPQKTQKMLASMIGLLKKPGEKVVLAPEDFPFEDAENQLLGRQIGFDETMRKRVPDLEDLLTLLQDRSLYDEESFDQDHQIVTSLLAEEDLSDFNFESFLTSKVLTSNVSEKTKKLIVERFNTPRSGGEVQTLVKKMKVQREQNGAQTVSMDLRNTRIRLEGDQVILEPKGLPADRQRAFKMKLETFLNDEGGETIGRVQNFVMVYTVFEKLGLSFATRPDGSHIESLDLDYVLNDEPLLDHNDRILNALLGSDREITNILTTEDLGEIEDAAYILRENGDDNMGTFDNYVEAARDDFRTTKQDGRKGLGIIENDGTFNKEKFYQALQLIRLSDWKTNFAALTEDLNGHEPTEKTSDQEMVA